MSSNPRYARHIGIVHQLRSRSWVSATSLGTRFDVSVRTIYRDIEQLIEAGLPIESTAGASGGYRLSVEAAIDPLVMDADDALRLYVLGLLDPDADTGDPDVLQAAGVSAYSRDALHKLSTRMYFDTRDWYWKDEGSGHVPALRYALLTTTAVEITVRVKQSDTSTTRVVKPYGLVWKGGEWWLVAAPLHGEPERIRLNHIDRLARTDLHFTHPDSGFNLREWWHQDLDAYGRGPNRVVLAVKPAAREEMSRLGLKPDSQVIEGADGLMRIVLFVDKWLWLVPLIASYGVDVIVESPDELAQALHDHHLAAAAAYDLPPAGAGGDYRHDDSRLRATRGRNPRAART